MSQPLSATSIAGQPPQAAGGPGSPFLWFVSFGEAKEMNPSAGRNRHENTVPQAQKKQNRRR
ncbi:hypothetical protein [Chitinilyticum aquatile]|uniref:hypothetical protein n=1 Tax=Chitinilyticum aquatile TaxID=362520 RepID=UPI0004281453|nr:hypothetical protein [Chitinilyticum aquatile]